MCGLTPPERRDAAKLEHDVILVDSTHAARRITGSELPGSGSCHRRDPRIPPVELGDTQRLRSRLDAARVPIQPHTVDFRELEGLPAPSQRFFRSALTEGQPTVAKVRVRHRGTFNMGEARDQWKPFTSDQKVVAKQPGFDWDGRIAIMPGLPVRVHDAYIAGEGLLRASLLGLFTLASVHGTRDMAEGELMRYLAEAAWYPTALLPSQGVHWEPVDDRSARATLNERC